VYLGVFAWLAEKGIRQWLRPVELESFKARQARGELLGCFAGPELAAVVTLGFEASPYWTEQIGGDRQWWIKSLAVSPRYRGAGIGAYSMGECERAASSAGAKAVFLDCVDAGFLPSYYSRAGYEEVARKEITYPSGNAFPMVLMRKNLAPEGADAGR
jgi:ribosomal protein S18 acetylase RimI-like enzyme